MPVALGCISRLAEIMDYVKAEVPALGKVGCAAIQPTAEAVFSFAYNNYAAGNDSVASVIAQAKQMIYDYQCDCRKLRGLALRSPAVMTNCTSGETANVAEIITPSPSSSTDSAPAPAPAAAAGNLGLWLGLGAAVLFIAFAGGKKAVTAVKRRRTKRAAGAGV